MNALQNGRSLQGANGAKSFFQKYYLVITFLLMFVVSCLLSPKFLTPLNLLNILTQNATTAILSYGMLFVIVTGGIDLSVGSFLALSVCLTAGLLNQNWPIAAVCLFVVLVMAAGGAIAGGLIAFGKIEPFIATLAMQQVVRGIAYIYQVGSVAVINNQTFLTNFAGNLGPIPIAIIYAAIIGVIMHILLKNTTFGRKTYAIGGSKEAAKLVGVSVNKMLISIYVLSAILAGIAGIIMAARLRVGTALVGRPGAGCHRLGGHRRRGLYRRPGHGDEHRAGRADPRDHRQHHEPDGGCHLSPDDDQRRDHRGGRAGQAGLRGAP